MKEVGPYCEKFFDEAVIQKPQSSSAIARDVLSFKNFIQTV
jgi:hypothetical protein